MSGNDDERHVVSLIAHRRIKDRHLLARSSVSLWLALARKRPGCATIIFRHTTFSARDHQIFDAHIGKRAAGHHEIIAPPRAIAVEVLRLDSTRDQILPS